MLKLKFEGESRYEFVIHIGLLFLLDHAGKNDNKFRTLFWSLIRQEKIIGEPLL